MSSIGKITHNMSLSNECIEEVIIWLKVLKRKNKDK